MEAMEGLEEMGDLSSQSVKAVAKLADSDQVRASGIYSQHTLPC